MVHVDQFEPKCTHVHMFHYFAGRQTACLGNTDNDHLVEGMREGNEGGRRGRGEGWGRGRGEGDVGRLFSYASVCAVPTSGIASTVYTDRSIFTFTVTTALAHCQGGEGGRKGGREGGREGGGREGGDTQYNACLVVIAV